MTKQKYQKPLHIDVPFDQALERFAAVAPGEVDEAQALTKAERQISALLEAFEGAKHESEQGIELWFARELMPVLGYKNWQNFRKVVEQAYISCREGGLDPAANFLRSDGQTWRPEEVFTDPSKNPKGGRPREDVILSRRAAYYIAENGDPSKLPIAIAQRYFAEQTGRQEVADESVEALTEDQRRVLIRGEVSEQNKGLAEAAHASGVKTPKDFAIFQSEGYKGMYGGLNVEGIKKAKAYHRATRSWTEWAAPNWPPICSASRRRRNA